LQYGIPKENSINDRLRYCSLYNYSTSKRKTNMKRRNAIKLAAGTLLGGGACVITLANAFKPEIQPEAKPKKLEFEKTNSNWEYCHLNPTVTAELAYRFYETGSCMYGVFNSVVSQLAEKLGEPYASFPAQMMKYGHSGVGGSGTICGTLNGAAALLGLLIESKETQDALIAELFHWYENTQFPIFKPEKPIMDYTPQTSEAQSILCHASTTKWGKVSGYRIDSKERKERCRRLTADVAAQTVVILNQYFENSFVTNGHDLYDMPRQRGQTGQHCR
jgi:hypothetical protein